MDFPVQMELARDARRGLDRWIGGTGHTIWNNSVRRATEIAPVVPAPVCIRYDPGKPADLAFRANPADIKARPCLRVDGAARRSNARCLLRFRLVP